MRRPLELALPRPVGALAILFLGVWIAVAARFGPAMAAVPLGVVLGLLILVNPTIRLSFVVFGGLLTLQSSQALDMPKVAYLVGVLLALGAAVGAMRRQSREGNDGLLAASILIFVLIGISLPVSLARGTDIVSWLRDAAPYFLLGCVPVLAADAASSLPRRTIVLLFALGGLLTAISFSLIWAGPTHRNLVDLKLDRFVYPSFLFAGALFAMALYNALNEARHRINWLLVAGFIFAVLLVTGTRTTLLLLVIPSIFLMSSRLRASRPHRFAILAGAALIVGFITLYAVQITSANSGALLGRFASFAQLINDPTADLSFADRLSQTTAAWNAFLSSPVFGVGLGHEFTWTGFAATPVSRSVIDTSASFPAKFGVVGVGLLIVIASLMWKGVRTYRIGHPGLELVLKAYMALLLTYLIFGSPFEEKGFAFGVLFLLALLQSESRVATGPRGVLH